MILGQAGHDFILGRGGGDTINTGSGSDIARGGLGNDEVIGLNGANSVNYLYGDEGDDVLRGRANLNIFVDEIGSNLFDGSPSTVDYAYGNLSSTYVDIDFIFLN